MRLLVVVLLALLAAARGRAQDSAPRIPETWRLQRGENVEVELARPLDSTRVRTQDAVWQCKRDRCIARMPYGTDPVEMCGRLRAHVGPIEIFRRGQTPLAAAAMRTCNAYALDREAGAVRVGDGASGRRPPPMDLERPSATAELRIAEVKSLHTGPLRAGGRVPVEVHVENTGGAAATVALRLLEPRAGGARLSYTPTQTIAADETRSWRLDLSATGSAPDGAAHCDEASERRIDIVERTGSSGVPGYRPGNSDGGAWIPFTDGVIENNERRLRFRFVCEVTLETDHPPPD